ncbi:MAG: hypothetical protein M1823_001224 [Watsoniomyces obsoletus]|nr:MAG: hypothetical protein M1823_001224 [Watsoniomyces obsoletus]
MPKQRYDSDAVDPAPLAQPLHFEFSGITAKNRLMKAAMTERLSSWDPKDFDARGIPSQYLINVYKRWGEGGYGVILTGNVMVVSDHLEAPGNAIIPPDAPFSGERFEAFKALAAGSKTHGSLILCQISHAGRQAASTLVSDPVSASDVQLKGTPMGQTFAKPHAASHEEIEHIKEAFIHAAEYAHYAGYDGVQLHGAHGYLLAQFLSATTNHRTDQYGGSLENRARIIVEIARGIRQRVPSSFVLAIKINSVEFQAKGFGPEEARELCHILEANQFDMVELSGGTYEELAFAHKRDSTRAREAFFLDFAEAIAPSLTKSKSYVTGGFKTVGGMVKALQSVDGVGVARPTCQDFRFAEGILTGKIKAAVKPLFDPNDFSIGVLAAGAQMRQVGKDQEPFDMSDEESMKAFKHDVEEFLKAAQEDTGLTRHGFLDLTAPALPYAAEGVAA